MTKTTATAETTATTLPTAAALRAMFSDIEKQLNGTLAERDREIHGVILAALAREHVLILGPAGTAKSALAHTFCTALGGTYFQWLLTRFSSPEELFGPVSLNGLKTDVFRRVTANKLPEASVAFLDEVFKANSAVLNSLLTALNERAFDNDGGRSAIPLETVVGASNELPEGPELAALYDRFMLRYWTAYTKTPEAFRRLLTGSEPSITATVTLDELHAAQAYVDAVAIPDATVEELFKLRADLGGVGVVASDRRWRKAARILRAVAWFEGDPEVTPDHFPILAHVMWDTPAQIAQINPIVQRYASAELAEVQEIVDAMVGLLQELPAKTDEGYATKVTTMTRELKRAMEKIDGFATAAKDSAKPKIAALKADLDKRYKQLRRDATAALGL